MTSVEREMAPAAAGAEAVSNAVARAFGAVFDLRVVAKPGSSDAGMA